MGKILANGYHAEIKDNNFKSVLIVRNNTVLSTNLGNIIKHDGYQFQYCYCESGGESVFIFSKKKESGEDFT